MVEIFRALKEDPMDNKRDRGSPHPEPSRRIRPSLSLKLPVRIDVWFLIFINKETKQLPTSL
jgi:hypothetical protein